MKTTFGRLFAMSAALIFLCLLLLGITFRLMLDRGLEEEKRQAMQDSAQILADLASAYDATGELEYRWGNFHICLTTAAMASGSDMLLCDMDGTVRICSCQSMECIHADTVVGADVIDAVLETGEVFLESDLGGLYDTPQFIEGMPVVSSADGSQIGVLIVAAERAQTRQVSVQATTILCEVSVFGLVAALIMSYAMSRRQAGSILQIARTAARFGRGELDVRAEVSGSNTEEVNELAAAFNNMADSLAASERQRKEFVANVSHELKTPMTTIAGFTDGILDGTIPPQEQRHYLQMISDEVRRLSRLVRSMLEISRLQSQGIAEDKKRRFDLCETVGQVLISFEQRVNRKRIEMDVQLPERSVWTKADPDSITQVIYNLTDNAIKFCEEGGKVSLFLQTDGGKARVIIGNTGGTIDPAELPLIFDRFHKADKSRSADREGVGLGLYIVKTILNSHGEDIYVTSENGVTTFTFTLPQVR